MATGTVAASAAAMVSARVRASWDTNPSPKPLNLPKTLKNFPRHSPAPQTPESSPAASTAVVERKPKEQHPSQFLSSNRARSDRGKLSEQYLGYERWLPAAPKVKKPRSIWNAASLAYVGDCIYELYARRHFLFPPLSINQYNERVMKVVRCESQDLLLKKLLSEDYLTEEERDVLRWGKNIATNKTRTTKRVGVAVYNRASSLETLVPLPSTAPTTIPVTTTMPPAPKPLLTYSRRSKVHASVSVPPEHSSTVAGPSHVDTSTEPTSSDLDILIALWKGKRSCTKYPIFDFVCYNRLTPSFRQFALPLSSELIPRSHEEAMLVPAWKPCHG